MLKVGMRRGPGGGGTGTARGPDLAGGPVLRLCGLSRRSLAALLLHLPFEGFLPHLLLLLHHLLELLESLLLLGRQLLLLGLDGLASAGYGGGDQPDRGRDAYGLSHVGDPSRFEDPALRRVERNRFSEERPCSQGRTGPPEHVGITGLRSRAASERWVRFGLLGPWVYSYPPQSGA